MRPLTCCSQPPTAAGAEGCGELVRLEPTLSEREAERLFRDYFVFASGGCRRRLVRPRCRFCAGGSASRLCLAGWACLLGRSCALARGTRKSAAAASPARPQPAVHAPSFSARSAQPVRPSREPVQDAAPVSSCCPASWRWPAPGRGARTGPPGACQRPAACRSRPALPRVTSGGASRAPPNPPTCSPYPPACPARPVHSLVCSTMPARPECEDLTSWDAFCAFPPTMGLACRARPQCCVMQEGERG